MSFSCESPLFCVDILSFIVTIVLKLGECQFLACRTGVIFSRFLGVRKHKEAGLERVTTAASPVARVSSSTLASRRRRSPEKREKNINKITPVLQAFCLPIPLYTC